MKIQARHEFNAPLEIVLAVAKDRTRDVEVYPNVTNLQVDKWEEDDAGIRMDIVTRADGDIPTPLRKILTPKMISWREIGYFDIKKGRYDYEIKTFYFSDVFSMKGAFTFTRNGDGKTVRELNAEIKIKIPILGGIAESAIAHNVKNNLAIEMKSIDKYLKMPKYEGEAEKIRKML